MDSDWSELPEDLLSQIILKLISSSSSALDCVRLGAVCVEWRSFLFRNVKFPIPFPLLLIPYPLPTTTTTKTTTTTTQEGDEDDQNPTTTTTQEVKMNKYNYNNITTTTTTTTTTTIVRKSRGISFYYSISDRKFYYLESSLSRLLSNRWLCHGSTTQGWLVTLDPYDNFSIRLYNPFNTTTSNTCSIINNNNFIIDIPSLSVSGSTVGLVHSDISCWRKIVLSSSPSLNLQPNNFVVMLLVEIGEHSCGLFTYSAQNRVWNTVSRRYGYSSFAVEDVIYFRHQFYYVCSTGLLFICDNLHPEQSSRVLTTSPTEIMQNQESKKYLVETSERDLLQVQRNYNPMLPRFQVFKLLMEEKEDMKFYRWVEIKTLNGCILFLSENASMSFSASDLIGYKPNCIYFSDHRRRKGSFTHPSRVPHPIIPLGVGVFNLEDGSIEQQLPPPAEPSEDTNSTPPIWIQTMLYMSRQ